MRVLPHLLATGAATLLLVGCGDLSKDSASSQLSSQFSASSISLPNGLTPATFAQCIVNRLFDSGKFSNEEVQKVLKANSPSDLSQDLQNRYTQEVQTPCLGGTSSTSVSSSSSASGDTATSQAATS